jgi:hypothetical protein
LLASSSQAQGLSESKTQWKRILTGEGETYLRAFAFFVEHRRLPNQSDALPEIE